MNVRKVYELPGEVERLALLARQEGYQFLHRLIVEFHSRRNCFDRPGEALFAVYVGAKLIGIGGVTIDPYTAEMGVGRIRRFYIDPKRRRSGVGQALLSAIEDHSRGHFNKLCLFTDTESAARFYEQLGYIRTNSNAKVSHVKSLQVQ